MNKLTYKRREKKISFRTKNDCNSINERNEERE